MLRLRDFITISPAIIPDSAVSYVTSRAPWLLAYGDHSPFAMMYAPGITAREKVRRSCALIDLHVHKSQVLDELWSDGMWNRGLVAPENQKTRTYQSIAVVASLPYAD